MLEKQMEVKEFIMKFQREYEKKDVGNLEAFVREFFLDEEDTSLVGTGVKDWFFGISNISKAFKEYRTCDEKFLKNIELDAEASVVHVEGDTAVAAVCGKSMRKYSSEERYNDMLGNIKGYLKETNNTKLELIDVSQRIARMLYEIEFGEDYVWPLRTTFFLIKAEGGWLIKHLNISFGANNGWEDWFTDEDIPEVYKTIPLDSVEDHNTKEIRLVLKKIQEGYAGRDTANLESFTKEVFTRDENSYIFGTDEGENFEGVNAGYDLTEGDWMYWGDFDINPDKSYIYVHNNMAFVYSKAFLRDENNSQDCYNSLGSLFHEYLINEETTAKRKLLKMLWKTTSRVFDAEYPGDITIPMKFVGVLIKRDNKWRFQHMHFSDNIDGMPEERRL